MKVEFIESEFWAQPCSLRKRILNWLRQKMPSSTAWLMLQPLLQIYLTWIIPLHGANTMQLWMLLRKTEQLFLQLAPHSIQSVDGLKFKCRTTINRNVCFMPMRMGIT